MISLSLSELSTGLDAVQRLCGARDLLQALLKAIPDAITTYCVRAALRSLKFWRAGTDHHLDAPTNAQHAAIIAPAPAIGPDPLALNLAAPDITRERLMFTLRSARTRQPRYMNAQGEVPPYGWPEVIDELLQLPEFSDPFGWVLSARSRVAVLVFALDLLNACVPPTADALLSSPSVLHVGLPLASPGDVAEILVSQMNLSTDGFGLTTHGASTATFMRERAFEPGLVSVSMMFNGFTHALDDLGNGYLLRGQSINGAGAPAGGIPTFEATQIFYPQLHRGARRVTFHVCDGVVSVRSLVGARRPFRLTGARRDYERLGPLECTIELLAPDSDREAPSLL
jgi:hypothetical protein